jgi:uncharacterized caspase-like protein
MKRLSWLAPIAFKSLKSLGPVLRLGGVAGSLAVASVGAQAPLDIRVALIIGNSAYVGAPVLGNPANDARAMSEVLRSLGFSVVELRDGNRVQMAAAITRVRDSLKGKQGVGMLYYAGHGLQLDWHNYMVPVDARLNIAADVAVQTIDLSSVIDAFKVAGNRMNIVVLDACRDNPFASSTSSAKGLAQLDAPPGTFLAYATAPGNVAEDGDEKSGNGLYTQYLLQELKKPTAKIEDVFKRVRLNVRKQSQGRQIPWESTSLEDDFFFNDGVKFTIKPEEIERMAAEVKAREQQRLATAAEQEAQTRERERQLARQVAQERERQQAEAQALEQQRLLAIAHAKEIARQSAEALQREQDKLAAEVRLKEQQRLTLEAQARERERVLALEQAKERERQQAVVLALAQQSIAALARAKEVERLGAEARVREQEKLAAEARGREQQRLALEAQARERERILVLEQAKERERQQAEAQALEQQRLVMQARAKEVERLGAETRAREQEKLAAEARAREQQRLALEAQAREREQLLAQEQAKERQRQLAEAQAREQQRAADMARVHELDRLAALAKVPIPDKKLSKEELKEIAFKEEKAAWDLIKTSSKADDFYAFLERYPSAGELAEMAQYRLDQLAKPKIHAALGQGQDASLGYTGARFKVGDEYEVQMSDILTQVQTEKFTRRVTAIAGDTVQFNDGAGVGTMLGAAIKNGSGAYDPPYGGIPVEFQVGKTWSGRSTRLTKQGRVEELQHSTKIVGRETITVPAGTFQTYVMETFGFISTDRTLRRKTWWDPRYGFPIKSEDIVRNQWRIVRSDRQELVAIKAERS